MQKLGDMEIPDEIKGIVITKKSQYVKDIMKIISEERGLIFPKDIEEGVKVDRKKLAVNRCGEYIGWIFAVLNDIIFKMIIKMVKNRTRENPNVITWRDISNILSNADYTAITSLCIQEVERLLDLMAYLEQLNKSKKKEKNEEGNDEYRISNQDLYNDAVAKLEKIAPNNIKTDRFGLKSYDPQMKVHNQLKKIIKNVFKDDDTKSSILSSLNKDDEEDEDGDDDSGDEDIEEEMISKDQDEEEGEGEDATSDKNKSSEAKIRTYSSAVLYLNVLAERLTDRFTRAAYTISYSSKRKTMDEEDVYNAMKIILVGELGDQIYQNTFDTVEAIKKYRNERKAQKLMAKQEEAAKEGTSEKTETPKVGKGKGAKKVEKTVDAPKSEKAESSKAGGGDKTAKKKKKAK